MLGIEVCGYPRRRLFAAAVLLAVALPALSQEQKPAEQAPEPSATGVETGNRPLASTGTGERGLSQTFPEASVWLELEDGGRALGLYYPEARLPARGAVVVLADEGDTAASGLAGSLARALASRGWAVLALGLEAPSPALQRILARPVAGAPESGPDAKEAAPAESVMIDVVEPEKADDLEARYRNRISQGLEAGLAELVKRGYERPALLGIGQASIYVAGRVLDGANASALIWVAPRFYPVDRADLPERLASLGTPLLDLHPVDSGRGAPGWSPGERLLRAGVESYQQQPIPWLSPPSATLGDVIASRAAAWLESL